MCCLHGATWRTKERIIMQEDKNTVTDPLNMLGDSPTSNLDPQPSNSSSSVSSKCGEEHTGRKEDVRVKDAMSHDHQHFITQKDLR
jgi:hypothetical protein